MSITASIWNVRNRGFSPLTGHGRQPNTGAPSRIGTPGGDWSRYVGQEKLHPRPAGPCSRLRWTSTRRDATRTARRSFTHALLSGDRP
ncbi:hypothetical protein ACNRBS_04915, partial [Ralstonia pseudosolanacearum]|uniref:hypothetical protein n=1 Tax=Ralstonia pseudosolanacearum TaxID=1310165 RepID=UPI000CE542FD